MILTPGGWKHKSNVHRIEPGYHVSGAEGRIRKIHTASGKVVEDFGAIADAVASTKGRSRKERPPSKKIGRQPTPASDFGWTVYSDWTNGTGNPLSYFSSTWEVPPAPASNDGQLVYLFNGLQTSETGDYILQPVLQWGYNPDEMDGGPYWVINNWFVVGEVATVGSTFVQVTPGTVLQGIMTLTAQSGGNFNYQSVFTGYPQCNLSVTDIDELAWAAETLECYTLSEFSDYPNAPLTAFHDIEIKVRTAAGDVDTPIAWTPNNMYTDNGQQCLIVSNDNPGGDVYLYYEGVQPSLYFVTDKSTFGKDEVTDALAGGGKFSNAFWVELEGYTLDQLSIDQSSPLTPTLSGAFKGLTGITITPNSAGLQTETDDPYVVQRIRWPFDITFSSTNAFPTTDGNPIDEELIASITIKGSVWQATTYFELAFGADPYFTNVDPSNPDAVFYLSQDLRVFSAAAGDTPFPGAPAFTSDPYGSIQSLIGYLNANQTTPVQPDPLNVLPEQTGYETGDSSVTPLNGAGQTNYNFAIARVRLQDAPSSSAPNVRVFFRLFVGQSFDTDYQPNTTYKSIPGSASSGADAGLPVFPQPSGSGLTDPSGVTLQTVPFFATDPAGTNDYDGSNPNANIRSIQIPSTADMTWAYFGCVLDVYNATVQGEMMGTHHCLVAQIAYDDDPIINPPGFTWSPENLNKLAQRNLQITSSGSPGPSSPGARFAAALGANGQAAQQIPQVFDTRPSPALSTDTGDLTNYPDEMMIDWGNLPEGTVASIYWPGVSAANVLQLASKLYATRQLSAVDANTISCTVSGDVTYIPIPTAAGTNFAGLFTLSLPSGISVGQTFNVKVRRIASRRFTQSVIPGPNKAKESTVVVPPNVISNWRYVTGTFQVQIPVARNEALLPAEENTLAILKWRLANLTPVSRWYPVLQKYISYVSARVNAFGGNASTVPPSLQGYTPITLPVKKCCVDTIAHTGRVVEILYNCFGVFEGFVLETCCKRELIKSCEEGIEKIALLACRKRLFLSVVVDYARLGKVCSLVVQGTSCGQGA
jgi:hypothetical protein